MKLSVIITAGGIGKRMGTDLPKQFLLLHNKPVLMHTIEQFYAYHPDFQIVITLPKQYFAYWDDLCEKYDFSIAHEVVEGGKERYHSIKNALALTHGELIFVHDAVRPLVSYETIKSVEKCAIINSAAIPVLPLKESLRKGNENDSQHVDRSQYWSVQTPQAFQRSLLVDAYSLPFSNEITDDASLIERLGEKVYLTTGNEENIKLTTPYDMKVAEFLMENKLANNE